MNKRIVDMTSEELADAVNRGVLEAKACIHCGKEFYALRSSTAKKPLEHGCDLESMVKAALEHHMTYGKYVEMLEKAHEHGV